MSDPKADSDRLYQDPALAQFYDLENGWAADFSFCQALAKDARSVLDLGCGTGELALALAKDRTAEDRTAENKTIVGVDPAAAMLDVARGQPGGSRVTWHLSDAQSLRLDRRFDLIVLTGHAFQVFLTEADQRALLNTIALHLNPQGRFIFDTRNPAAEAWRDWTPERSKRELHHPRLGAVEAWNDAAHDAASGIVTYQTHYRVMASGETLSAESRIRFTSREALTPLLADAGLTVDEWFGDWEGGSSMPSAPEVIPLGRLVTP